MLTAGINYLQSVTPNLALGGEAFWLGQQRRSGVGFAFRHVIWTLEILFLELEQVLKLQMGLIF